MSFTDDMKREMARLSKEESEILEAATMELYRAVIEVSPVDTGELRQSWQMPDKISERSYAIRNIAPHALVIDSGIRDVGPGAGHNGRDYNGSWQLPEGYTPIVHKVESEVNRKIR